MSNSLDIMAVGAHPDDVEIGMGGTIAKYSSLGRTCTVVHLTKAELSSNGTVESRQNEAKRACGVLGINPPVQLDFPDRGLFESRTRAVEKLVALIRIYRPRLLFAPYEQDRHPDHGHCSHICREAFFSAGIKKFLEGSTEKAYRPEALYFYQINGTGKPDFLVDISDYTEVKYRALSCFESQFFQDDQSVNTPLNSGYIENLQGRDRLYGAEAGVDAAEGFKSDKPLLIQHLLGDV